MRVGEFLRGAQSPSQSRSSVLGKQPETKKSEADRAHDGASGGKIEVGNFTLPKPSQWLNPSYRQLAERRLKAAQIHSFPYIIARQEIGGNEVFDDGSIAYRHILLKPSSMKMFGNEDFAWDSSAEKTSFFCVLPGQPHLVSLGTVNEMFERKLNGGEIGCLLGGNAYLDEESDDDEEEQILSAEWQAVSRASFYLLNSAGEIFPQNQRAADVIFQPLSGEEKGFAMANVMAMSAGSHELTLLKLAVRLGFDPNQRSRLVEATPLEHAENKKNEVARQFLAALRPPK